MVINHLLTGMILQAMVTNIAPEPWQTGNANLNYLRQNSKRTATPQKNWFEDFVPVKYLNLGGFEWFSI